MAFAEESFGAFEDFFAVVLVESIVVLSIFLLELCLLLFWDVFHVFFIEQGYLLDKGADDVPDICDSSVFFDSG